MDPEVLSVKPLDNYELLLTFTNDEQRVFDSKPYWIKACLNACANAHCSPAPVLCRVQLNGARKLI